MNFTESANWTDSVSKLHFVSVCAIEENRLPVD